MKALNHTAHQKNKKLSILLGMTTTLMISTTAWSKTMPSTTKSTSKSVMDLIVSDLIQKPIKLDSKSGQALRVGGGADVGGGDTIRAYFIRSGESVLRYLNETPEGQALVAEHKLNLEKLSASLNVDVIQVVDEVLIDRTGSLVEATGQPGEIKLHKLSWSQHLDRENDIYFLVFHEMLRENGINDDNYVISKSLAQFPENLKLRKVLLTSKKLIDTDRLSDAINKNEIQFGGPGCPGNSLKTMTRFDETQNTFEIYPGEMAVAVGPNSAGFDRKSCNISIPFRAAAGKKIIITQLDIVGEVDIDVQKSVRLTFETFNNQAGTGQLPTAAQNKIIESTDKIVDGGFIVRENTATSTACGGQGILRLNASALMTDKANTVRERVSFAKVSKMALSLKSVDCATAAP